MAVDVFSAAGADTWTCPAGVFIATLRIWSGGGAGGNDDGSAKGGMGGAGGGYGLWTIFPTPGVTYNLWVGAGGIHGTEAFTGAGAGNGGMSQFGGTVYPTQTNAVYGIQPTALQRGGDGAGTCTGFTLGGQPGSAYYGPTFYDEAFGAGGGSCWSTTTGGGGGSSAGTAVDGNAGSPGVGGSAPADGGAGGNHAVNGSAPGGGGGGASVGEAPGDGGAGRIEIEYLQDGTSGSGSFAFTGTAVLFRYFHLNAGSGSFSLSGTSAQLLWLHKLLIGSGNFACAGQAVGRKAASGNFAFSGSAVTFPRTYVGASRGFPLPPVGRGRVPSGIPGVQR